MNNQKQQLNVNIDIKNTTSVNSKNGTPILLAEGIILRKGSRFLLGTDTDPLIPIPVMYDISNNLILLDMIPKEIRDEYKNVGFSL
jgi:hypothetical protein